MEYLRLVNLQDIPLLEGDCLLEKYNVFELTKRLNDTESLKARIRAEFVVSYFKNVQSSLEQYKNG